MAHRSLVAFESRQPWNSSDSSNAAAFSVYPVALCEVCITEVCLSSQSKRNQAFPVKLRALDKAKSGSYSLNTYQANAVIWLWRTDKNLFVQ